MGYTQRFLSLEAYKNSNVSAHKNERICNERICNKKMTMCRWVEILRLAESNFVTSSRQAQRCKKREIVIYDFDAQVAVYRKIHFIKI